jgi:hypothetical protein
MGSPFATATHRLSLSVLRLSDRITRQKVRSTQQFVLARTRCGSSARRRDVRPPPASVCFKSPRAVILLCQLLVLPDQPGVVGPYGAAFIEDNGNPVDGQPVDLMADFAVQTANLRFFCESDLVGFFLTLPLASGNFVVNDG